MHQTNEPFDFSRHINDTSMTSVTTARREKKKAAHDDANWSSKYLSSDHHDDRLIHSVASYEAITGKKFPGEPLHFPGKFLFV